ncbi:MAG: DNA repair protein RadA, partial [Planctomycetes bacterium]|nr:DNA repair protein RadA [Planctomycetota bacterium]
MAKKKTVYACRECGYISRRWLGKCPSCNEWDTLIEEVETEEAPVSSGSRSSRGKNKPVPVTEIFSDGESRVGTGVKDLDRILGGGLVQGSAILIGGEPGIGKSTLLMQVSNWLAKKDLKILYVTAEESEMQIKLRAERLDCLHENLLALAENNLDNILAAGENTDCGAIIVDSIQMVYWADIGSAPGSVGQVRECAAALIAQAKRRGVPLFLVGHVTKDGAIAGPKVLEHMVDVVLNFEGDRFHAARILRAAKNRFGAVNEIGVFEMGARGLIPVLDPSALFLSGRKENAPGTVVTAPLEGTRPFLVEVQALVAPGYPGNARRRVSGIDSSRAAMLLAVLEKRCELVLSDQDVFMNVVGGADVREPGADLALALAIAGSF